YRVEARIIIWESNNALKVPAGALFRRQNAWAAFKLDSGRAELQEVQVGHRGENEVEIRSGLTEGEAVILHPSDRVADGVRVKARE
ncbi:MAG: efflux RND transporter periplasmic adaptor subunit, partial [Limisphaerales bacterium]